MRRDSEVEGNAPEVARKVLQGIASNNRCARKARQRIDDGEVELF